MLTNVHLECCFVCDIIFEYQHACTNNAHNSHLIILQERTDELDREKHLFGTKLAQQNDRILLDIEIRKTELDKLKEVRKKEFVAEERKAREELGAAPTGMCMYV